MGNKLEAGGYTVISSLENGNYLAVKPNNSNRGIISTDEEQIEAKRLAEICHDCPFQKECKPYSGIIEHQTKLQFGLWGKRLNEPKCRHTKGKKIKSFYESPVLNKKAVIPLFKKRKDRHRK